MAEQDADRTYESLIEGGFDQEVASIVRDQLRVKELESYATEIRELLDAKSALVNAKAAELFAVLEDASGLSHTLPTSISIQHRGVSDTIDLSVAVTRSERGTSVSFVWKTHNIHLIETIPEGFSLGSLNVGKRREQQVETQIPVLAMSIRPARSERRTLFSSGNDPSGRDGARQLDVTFRLNRSWIEQKSSSSDAQLDSTFPDSRDFLDFLSDHSHHEIYAMLTRLIAGLSEVLSSYLEEKRRFITGLEL